MILALNAHPLVHLNVALNALAAVLLVTGFVLIKRRRLEAHARVMMATFAVSSLFLLSYLMYHYVVGMRVEFTHPGVVRTVYRVVLFTHIPLAMLVPFLASRTMFLGLRGTGKWGAGRFSKAERKDYLAKHRRLAHWTFPIWLYVSITGVIVYAMLYHLWPPAVG